MPVSFNVAGVERRQVFKAYEPVHTPEELLNAHVSKADRDRDWVYNAKDLKPPPVTLLQSSFTEEQFGMLDVRSERNGFVQAVTHAYNRHHHLVIRPDDVWIAILSQFNIYINKHSTRLRSRFVRHDSKKKLTFLASGTRHTADSGDLAMQMTELINENVIQVRDPDLKSWILPDFTTTTPNDTVVCSVMLMATMKNYFDYEMTMCGLPSVTLEGEKRDYQNIYQRISKLETLFPSDADKEPKMWITLLRPVLRRFAEGFDNSGRNPSNIDFWNRVSHHYSHGSGTQYLSGWITAFCVWDGEGRWQATPRTDPVTSFDGQRTYRHPNLVLDGVQYPSIDIADIAIGFCEVDVKVCEGESEVDGVMVAGHMANLVEGRDRDTLKPLPAWFIYVKPVQMQPPISAIDEDVISLERQEPKPIPLSPRRTWKDIFRRLVTFTL